MSAPRERLAHTDLDRRTDGFFFRAFEEFEDLVLAEPTIAEATKEVDVAEHKKMRDQIATGFVTLGFEFLEERLRDHNAKRVIREAHGMMLNTQVVHTYFGELEDLDVWTLSRNNPFVQPQQVSNESPYFLVMEHEGDEGRFIVVPEQWLRNGVDHDSNLRIESLALLAHTAAYMYGYRNRDHLQGDIMTGMAKANPDLVANPGDDFADNVAGLFHASLETAGTLLMRTVLRQAGDEVKIPAFSSDESAKIGFAQGRYSPTQDVFSKIFY